MLKIRMETEDWREYLVNRLEVDEIDAAALADELCSDTLTRLHRAGVDYERAYQQSVGAFCILQRGGSDADRAAFDDALDAALAEMRKSLASA